MQQQHNIAVQANAVASATGAPLAAADFLVHDYANASHQAGWNTQALAPLPPPAK